MSSLYTDDVRYIFHGLGRELAGKQLDLTIDISEDEFQLNIILYRSEFNRLDGEDKKWVAQHVGLTINKIRQELHIPCYLEVKDAP